MKVDDIITLPFSDNIVSKTIDTTIRKFKNTSSDLMYERTPVEILDNIFMGDIAKNCLIDYLRPFSITKIIDYDEIRLDDFMNSDPGWDFKIGNKEIKVEVKSSIPPNGESFNDIISKRDIKITASHDKGITWISPENLESRIHVQVYFYAKPYKNGAKTMDELYNKIKDNHKSFSSILNIDKYNKPLFFGWASKKEIINYSRTLNPNTWTFSWTKRLYWRCPISEAHNMEELISVMNNY